jgi:hypothetical protein
MPDPVKKIAVPIDMLGQAIRHLAAPVNADDAATRTFTESEAAQARADAVADIIAQRGVPSGFASLTIDGTLQPSQLPALAITDTFVVASQATMLALTAQRGDVAIRSDLGKSFILATDNPAVVGNWVELVASGYVLSVDGLTGVVRLSHQATIGDGTATLFSIAHGLGTRDVQVAVLDTADAYAEVDCRVTRPDANTVVVEVGGAPPAAGAYRVVVGR